MEQREQGNALFRVGDYGGAEIAYGRGLASLGFEDDDGDAESSALRVVLLANRAQCRLMLGKPSEAVVDCLEATKIDPTNWKAFHRMGLGMEQLMNFAGALDAVMNVLRIHRDAGARSPVPEKTVLGLLRKRDELKKLVATYRPPALSKLEQRALCNEDHTLRLSIKDSDWPKFVRIGEKRLCHCELFVGNEFGLFKSDLFKETLIVHGSIFHSGQVLVSEEMSTNGRVKLQFKLECNENKDIQLEFKTNYPYMIPVLSLPIRVLCMDDPAFVHDERMDQFSCCRPLDIIPGELPRLLIYESGGEIGIPGKVWDGALLLARCVFNLRDEFLTNKQVLELGAGTGTVGIACAAMRCAEKITITDLPGKVLDQISANVELNCKAGSIDSGTVAVAPCAWGETPVTDFYDTVVMSDVVYDPEIYEPLLKTLQDIFNVNPRCQVVWSHRHRNPEDHLFFQAIMDQYEVTLLKGRGPSFLREGEEFVEMAKEFKGKMKSHPKVIDANDPSQQHISNDITIYVLIKREV